MSDSCFLVCEHCGFHNEAKSEFLVFCGHCGKKMGSTYTNWKKDHPGQSFEDYKKLVCVPADELPVEKQAESNQPFRFSRNFMIRVVIIVVLFIVIVLATNELVHHYFYPGLEKYAETGWTMQDCGNLGLRINSPLALEPDPITEDQIGENTTDVILDIETYSAGIRANRLNIATHSVRYKSGVKGSLRGAVEGSIRDFRSKPGITNFKYNITAIRHSGIPGRLIRGKWKEGNRFYGFQQAIYIKKNMAWVVMIIYDLEDRSGKDIAERIIRSISITPNIAVTIIQLPEATDLPVRARRVPQFYG